MAMKRVNKDSDSSKPNCRCCRKKSKSKKIKDSTLWCKRCIHFNNGTCSLNGCAVDEKDTCRSFSNETIEACQRCGRKIHYTNREEYYNSIIHFSMVSGSGTASGQNVHLCRKCESAAHNMFEDLLEKIREYTPYNDSNTKNKSEERDNTRND